MISTEKHHVNVLNANTKSAIKQIIESGVNDAFYTCNIGTVIDQYEKWVSAMPRVEPHFAIKANANDAVIEVLATLGAGFDCASKHEIQQVISQGIDPDRIIFANPGKVPEHISYAASVGVTLTTFDSECELRKIKKYFPEHSELVKPKAVFRIKVDDPLHKYVPLSKKFGCDHEKYGIAFLQKAKELEIDVVGVSFHVGSPNDNGSVFRDAIKAAKEVFDMGRSLGFKMNLLDIGGGFAGKTGCSLDDTAKIINEALEEFFPDPEIRVISEPGRYFTTSAFTLGTQVTTFKPILIDNNKYFEYYLDTGVFNCFLTIFMDKKYTPEVLEEKKGSKNYSCTLWGPTCDSYDKIGDNFLLPELDVGDWIIFKDMGAYTSVYYTPFNGFPEQKVINIIDEAHLDKIKGRVDKLLFNFAADY